MNSSKIDVSIVIVSFNTREILRECLSQALTSAAQVSHEIIVVDNASEDGSADMVEKDFPGIRLIRSGENLGFGAANNVAFAIAQGEFILLLNPDALIDAEAFPLSLKKMHDNPKIGMGGAKLIGRNGDLQPSARLFPSLLNEALGTLGLAYRFPNSRFFGRADRTWDKSDLPVSVDWVPGCFAFIRKSALESVGYFDERFFLYYEEVDLCLRFHEAGWEVWYWPDIVVKHTGGESSKTIKKLEFSDSGSQLVLWRMRSCALYYRKHHGQLSVYLLAGFEGGWQKMRSIWAMLRGDEAKKRTCGRVWSIWSQALKDTDAGATCPPKPW